MNRLQAILSIVGLAIFLLAPTTVLLASGPSEGYVFGRAQMPWPTLPELVAPKARGRKAFATAFLDRLALRRETIALRNAFSLDRLGYIDTPQVVSGAPGWLFYKPSLMAWDCLKHRRLDHGLHQLRLLLELADVNGLPIWFAAAPNKATIHRAEVTGRAAYFARCYFEYERRFRTAMAETGSSRWIDHAEVLDPTEVGRPTYLLEDTHWTQRDGYRALEQLAARIGHSPSPPAADDSDTVVYVDASKSTDLGNQILLLDQETPNPTPLWTGKRNAEGRETSNSLLVVHDSFYQEVLSSLEYVLPDATFANVNLPIFRETQPDDYDTIVVESVERELLTRIRSHDHFGWHSKIGHWVQRRTTQAAGRCDWSRAIDLLENPDWHDVERNGSGALNPTGPSPRLFAEIPTAPRNTSVCLEIQIHAEAPVAHRRVARIFLDARNSRLSADDRNAEFVHARSIEFRYGAGHEQLAFVVPLSSLGRRLRIDFQALSPGTLLRSLQLAPSGPLEAFRVERPSAAR